MFTTNKVHLDSETIAEQLRVTRQDRGVKLEKVAKDLKINIKYLDALEKGRFELLPKGLYGKNFLREYAQYLRLDYREMLEVFDAGIEASQKVREKDIFNARVVNSNDFLSYPKILRGIIIGSLVLVVAIYLIVRLEKIIAPPVLEINYPADNFITKDNTIDLLGHVEAESQLIVNGEQVVSDNQGNFSKVVGLKTGLNTITVMAQKKYGQTKTVVRQVLRQ